MACGQLIIDSKEDTIVQFMRNNKIWNIYYNDLYNFVLKCLKSVLF